MFVSEMRFLSQMFFSANSKMRSELSYFLSAENNEISVTTRGKRRLPRQWGWGEGPSAPTFSLQWKRPVGASPERDPR